MYSLDFIGISPFLILFEPLREPLMKFQTVYILKLQLYDVDMTIQNKFGTINFNLQKGFDFLSNNFLIFGPLAPLKWPKSNPIGAPDSMFYRYW